MLRCVASLLLLLFALLLTTLGGRNCHARQKPAANANSPIALPQIQTISFDADYPIRSVNTVTTSVRQIKRANPDATSKQKTKTIRLITVEDWFFFNAKDAPYLLSQGTFGVDAGNSEEDEFHYTPTPADGKQHRSLKEYTFKISGQGNGNSIYGIVNEFEAFYRSGWVGVKATLQIGGGTGIFKGAIGKLDLTGDFSKADKATCHVSGKITVSATPINVSPEEPFSKVLTTPFKTDLANTR